MIEINELRKGKVIIYCAGGLGILLCHILKNKLNVDVFAFADTYKSGIESHTGLPILTPVELQEHKDSRIIIGISELFRTKDTAEIKKRLLDMGFAEDKIIGLSEMSSCMSVLNAEDFDWQATMDSLYDFNVNRNLIEYLSDCIDKSDSSVVDLGAGAMHLKNYIPESVAYYPVDFFQRYPQTVVCDFNKREFPDIYADVYFACAVLYYMNDPVFILEKMAKYARKKILVCLFGYDYDTVMASNPLLRTNNCMYFDEITEILGKLGFTPSKDETIFQGFRRYILYTKQ